ncbi:hypothetical protein E4P34_03760 [Kocuria rhizophila]|uniref:EVE domain-containing protein n=1 Tax=Kocuria rhizophila TaxID=72000 RepID=A0AAX2SCC0_KOCRH|nr:hypothetical protein [Kocuria rhizophila]MDR7373581.1 hypothetical protein [Kocuria rhizophila]TFI01781.1 hypothetical protein E4P33_06585 [Kocuria rhizophila]TFI09516.1 hypothetical protein E4P34_03760 [Kocuria rhizophila]
MSKDVHWFLPINPASHAEHMPADWRTREDATEVWEAIGRSQPIDRWCLRTGFRTMKAGDVIWAYLSKRQELCAVGRVRRTAFEVGGVEADPAETRGGGDGGWYVYVDWDESRTAELCRHPIPRAVFGQVPMSVGRVEANARRALKASRLE